MSGRFYREIPKDSRSSSHFFSTPFLSWSHREEREREGWSHREEEEGERERVGPTVRRKRERGRGVVPP